MQIKDKELQATKKAFITALKTYFRMGGIQSFFGDSKEEKSLDEAKSYSEIFRLITAIEKNIFAKINHNLKKINKEKPFLDQVQLLNKIRGLVIILININKIYIQRFDDFFKSQSNSDIYSLYEKFYLDAGELNFENILAINENADVASIKQSNINAKEFLNHMRNLAIISLMKADLSEEGNYFIKKLNKSLQEKDHHIGCTLTYKINPSSLELSPNSTKAYARIKEEFKDTSLPLPARIKPIDKNTGSSSALVIPFWPEMEKDFEQNYGIYFKNSKSIERAFENLAGGSFSFDKNGDMFYTPFHLEVIHELIHGLHNSRGTNRNLIHAMVEMERDIWKDAEEYWAITGGKISENFFTKLVNAPLRYGHSGLSASVILKQKENEEMLKVTPKNLFHI